MNNKQSKKSEQTRENILKCAENLFYEKGFEKTTVREIVETAGVAQGTFYLYFETKDKILYKIFEKVVGSINNVLNSLDTKNPTFEDIDKVIDSIVEYMYQNPKGITILHNSRIVEIMNIKGNIELEGFSLTGIEKWILEAGNKGVINKKDSILYSKIIFQMIHELLESAFLFEYPDNIGVMQKEIKKIIRSILL